MFCRPLFGRFLQATFEVYLVFAFWQWAHADSWMPDFLGAIFLIVYLLGIISIYLPVFRAVHNSSKEELFYGEEPPANASFVSRKWGAISHPFKPRYFWFGLVFLLVYFLRACFIGLAQGRGRKHDDGLRQSIGLAVTDLLFFLVLCICRPGRDKTSNFVMIFLLVFRVISWGICIALTPLASIETIPRVVLGFALIVFTGLPIVYLFFLTLWDFLSPFLRDRQWNSTRFGDTEMNEKPPYAFGTLGVENNADSIQPDDRSSGPEAFFGSSGSIPHHAAQLPEPQQRVEEGAPNALNE
jgi:hypothetical protein